MNPRNYITAHTFDLPGTFEGLAFNQITVAIHNYREALREAGHSDDLWIKHVKGVVRELKKGCDPYDVSICVAPYSDFDKGA